MIKPKPQKRAEALQPLSREHHHGLLFCWKVRTGLKKGVEVKRIKKYADWFFKNHIIPHFKTEEKYVFTVLEETDDLIKKALAQHRKILRLFKSKEDLEKNLTLLEECLEAHIRFEERTLFNRIQEVASTEQLKQIELVHADEKFEDNLTDPFWE